MVVALMREDDTHHRTAAAWMLSTDEDLVTTPLALAEMDHLVPRDAAHFLWDDFESGAFGVRWWAEGLTETLRIARRHPFLGLVDASLVALAGVLRTTRIATFDQHFRSVS